MKTMKGFKVLFNEFEDRRSCSTWGWNAVTYLKNKETFPTAKGSKLFFFKDKDSAINFVFKQLKGTNMYKIVPCIAKNPNKIKFISVSCLDDKTFWKDYNNKQRPKCITTDAPQGTYVADSIKCLE